MFAIPSFGSVLPKLKKQSNLFKYKLKMMPYEKF